MYEITDISRILEHILPNNLTVTITIDDIRLKSNLKFNQTLIFTKNSFFYTILGSVQSYLEELGEFGGFIQLIQWAYKKDKPGNNTDVDKIHLKRDCANGSTVNGVRVPILSSFGLTPPPGHKLFKEPRIKLHKKINKSVLSHIIFYLEDDDHKQVIFNGESISFTC